MNRKPPDARFERYAALGPTRPYAALPAPFAATRPAGATRPAKQGWRERLAQIEPQSREKSAAMFVDAISAMRSRHLKTLRAVNARVLSALQQFTLNSGMEAIRGAEIAIKLERLVAGEASDHAQVDVAAVTREEMRRL